MGNDAMGSPRLANVGYVYIVKQLTNFAEDKRNDLTMHQMNGIAKGSECSGQARFGSIREQLSTGMPSFLTSKILRPSGTAVGEAYKGQILVRYGVEGKSFCMPVLSRL